MIGNWRWNAVLGFLGGLLTFVLSLDGNFLTTTLLRSLYSFFIIFILVFALRFVLGTVAGLKQTDETERQVPESDEELYKGANVDISTPDETDSIREMLKKPADGNKEDESTFSPMNPPRFVSANKVGPEQIAKAVRRMSEEEGR